MASRHRRMMLSRLGKICVHPTTSTGVEWTSCSTSAWSQPGAARAAEEGDAAGAWCMEWKESDYNVDSLRQLDVKSLEYWLPYA
eukprot:4545256-Karenia_brevis.AAC.1